MINVLVNIVIKLLKIFFVFIIVNFIIRKINNFFNNIIKSNFNSNLPVYNIILEYISYIIITISIIISLDIIGIKTYSVVTILGTIGITIVLSIKNFLSNISSGIIIIFLDLFKINDLIEIEKTIGYVKKINVFNTIIISLDNKEIIIPNNKFIVNQVIKIKNENEIINKKILFSEKLNIYINKNNNINKLIRKLENILKNMIYKKEILSFNINIKNFKNNEIEMEIFFETNKKQNHSVKLKILKKIIKQAK